MLHHVSKVFVSHCWSCSYWELLMIMKRCLLLWVTQFCLCIHLRQIAWSLQTMMAFTW